MAKTCIARLFPDFSEWLDNRNRLFKENLATIKKSLARNWYLPKPELELNDLAAERFPRQEALETYQRTLKGEGLSGDIVSTRVQASAMRACERAFNLRHTSIPRLLAHGYTENAIETNGLYSKIMEDRASYPIQAANSGRAEREA